MDFYANIHFIEYCGLGKFYELHWLSPMFARNLLVMLDLHASRKCCQLLMLKKQKKLFIWTGWNNINNEDSNGGCTLHFCSMRREEGKWC